MLNCILSCCTSYQSTVDFGLCIDTAATGEQRSMVGSPFWIPPEMIRREPHGKAVRCVPSGE